MSGLRDYFSPSGSGYVIHRSFLRRERLPECCRKNLSACDYSIRYLGNSGEDMLLPLVKCSKCGRIYAKSNEKYMPIDNLMKYEAVVSEQ